MTQQKKTALLVITQDLEFKRLIEHLMRHEQIQAAVSDGVAQAARFLLANPLPDVVILDLSMTGEQPLEFLKQLRARVEFSRLPVMVLTSIPDPLDLVRTALQLGANRYLTKLFAGTNLLSTVRAMVAEAKPMLRKTANIGTGSLGRESSGR